MTYYGPIPSHASKSSVSAFAERLAAALHFTSKSSVQELVTKLGGRVEYHTGLEATSEKPESIKVEKDGSFTIKLPWSTSIARDRFTIAHELGHLFLHFPKVQEQHPSAGMKATRFVDEADQNAARCEWEANWFSAAFIMPESEFREVWKNGEAAAAAHFGVSNAAAKVRAKSLGVA